LRIDAPAWKGGPVTRSEENRKSAFLFLGWGVLCLVLMLLWKWLANTYPLQTEDVDPILTWVLPIGMLICFAIAGGKYYQSTRK
jgi:hypothetical protein